TNECLESPCQHGGTCFNSDGSYTCLCTGSWTGLNCTDDTNECLESPCQHGGTCFNSDGSYTCLCTGSWTGLNCTD
ncbi:hypothetical protein ACJMK2_018638, partial [Sinanodonta woodiana]